MAKRPNIILIMTDDQGYGDLSCMGATDFVTPHFDALAASGARFSCLYSNSPVCSPSRAALLTGRYPGNAGVRSILAGTRKTTGLTKKVPTIATAAKALKYDTKLVGKWHLGLAPGSRPMDNGFDSFYGFMAGCIDYYSHIFYWGMSDGRTNPTHDLWDNDQETYENGEYFTELVTEKAVDYIEEHREKENPFLLFVGYNAPHYPMHAPEKYMNRFAHLPWDRQVMAAMLSCVDDGIGEIRAALERTGQLQDTIIYFQSDNGPSREIRNWLDGNSDYYYGGTAGQFRGHKFSLFEGGIRVPAMISWPGTIPAGQVIDEPCAAMDVFPTIMEALGESAEGYGVDGKSLWPMVTQGAPSPHERIFWEQGGQTALRKGRYKVVLAGQTVEHEGPIAPVFLADLVEDPGEKVNLADAMPELAKEMEKEALAWRQSLEARFEAEFADNKKNIG